MNFVRCFFFHFIRYIYLFRVIFFCSAACILLLLLRPSTECNYACCGHTLKNSRARHTHVRSLNLTLDFFSFICPLIRFNTWFLYVRNASWFISIVTTSKKSYTELSSWFSCLQRGPLSSKKEQKNTIPYHTITYETIHTVYYYCECVFFSHFTILHAFLMRTKNHDQIYTNQPKVNDKNITKHNVVFIRMRRERRNNDKEFTWTKKSLRNSHTGIRISFEPHFIFRFRRI